VNQSRTYQLYVKVAGRWTWLCDIQAATHADAFRDAMLCLKPEHYDKPIKLEAVETPADEPRTP
jgi:hypothetical protein